MLKITGIKLEKINDIEMHLFLEKGMRGGISYISTRYSKSDDLYETVMSFDYLPYGNFKWLSKEEIERFDLDSIGENSRIGYTLEVDLVYPKELHDIHSDYPLCPEIVEVNYEMLSNYCKDIVDKYNIKVGEVRKLIPNLYDKIEYPVHYKNLIYYFSLGMELKKIHRILSFKQSNWLEVFIDFNTKKRQEINDEFNKNLYKFFNNCIYSKSIENATIKINVKLINDKKKYQKIVNKPNFMSQKIIDKNFVAVHCLKKVLTLNKPVYVGFCILELSKLLMYQFHYDYILKTFNNKKLLFTDTDSLVYEIRGKNVYEQRFKDLIVDMIKIIFILTTVIKKYWVK